jgi:hypothetical protein
MDVSGGILASLDAGHPYRHDEDPAFSCSVGERKIMNHFVVISVVLSVVAQPR